METTVNDFVFEIRDIISKLQKGEFRDCDIKWLNGRIEMFIKIAPGAINKESIISEMNYTKINDFVTMQYLRHFKSLLLHIKDI